MTAQSELIERAVQQAHLPTLVVTLAHLTGRIELLREEWRPKYAPFRDPQAGGLDESTQVELREVARRLISELTNNEPVKAARPSQNGLHEMMYFIAGVKIPERYLPLLEEELGLEAEQIESEHRTDLSPTREILIVGAGMSGLLAGIKLKEAGYKFQIIERNAQVGGTWWSNTYPGCRVDSQNHLYSYSFFPNYDWPHRFSTQDALLAYFEKAATKYQLWEHIRLKTSLLSARYDERTLRWHATIENSDGSKEVLEVDAIISAVGQLNRPKIPDFPGRDSFRGPQFHSSTWRHDIDLRGKRVAVIGTGASAFQLIPEVAKQADQLLVLQRTAPWVTPTPDYHTEVGEGQQWLFKNLPFYANWYRFWLFWTMAEGAMPALKIDPEWTAADGSISASNQRLRSALVGQMKIQVGTQTELLEKIIPKSPYGGKRTLRDNGLWIETLKRSNVTLITEKIAKITADSIVTEDGVKYPTDVIIYGTGFQASRFLESTKIYGRSGIELNDMWAGDPKAYLGMTVPGFPNFFCVFGPNTNLVAQGSIIFFSECSVRYIVGCLNLLRQKHASAMEVKLDVHTSFNEIVDAENRRMAWGMEGVTNWYKSESGRVSQNWPFPLLDYWSMTRAPNPSDFDFSVPNSLESGGLGFAKSSTPT